MNNNVLNNRVSTVPADPVERTGYLDAERAIRRGRVDDVDSKLKERKEKCADGDAYSCGVAERLGEVEKLQSAINTWKKDMERFKEKWVDVDGHMDHDGHYPDLIRAVGEMMLLK